MRRPNSRRTIWIALALVLLGGLALFLWRGREAASPAGVAQDTDAAKPGARKAIGASEDEADGPAKLRWQDRSASITGTVREKGAGPIAGADVCVFVGDPNTPSAMQRDPVCTKTGVDGHYAIADLPPVSVSVHASAPKYIPNQYERAPDRYGFELHAGQQRTGVDIELAPGGVEIRGVVKDVAGGVIEGALVKNEAWGWGSSRSRGSGIAKSDERGEFSLWVAPGDVSISANAEGYAPGSARGPVPGYTFSILMTPESVLAGIVVRASDGAPVPGVRVESGSDWSTSFGFGFGTGRGVAFTDDDGRFRIDRLAPGRYKPSAQSDEGYGRVAQSVHLGLGQSVEDLRVELHPAATIRGRIVIAGSTPRACEDGSVSLSDKPAQRSAWDQASDDGSVEMLAVLPGTYDVEVHCDGMLSAESYPPIVVGSEPVAEQVWEVREGLAITGIVVGPDGVPVPEVSVSAQPKSAAPRGQVSNAWGHRTGADGRFRLAGLVAGVYAVHANVDGADLVAPPDPTDVELTAGRTPEVRIELATAGSVEGRVVDSDGKPIARANVHLRGDEHGWGGQGTSRDDGTFTIRDVRPESYRATASRGWGESMRAPGRSDDDVQGERVVVNAGEIARVELVVEAQSGTIRGKVVDEAGGPVDDAFVHTTRESDSARKAAGSNRQRARWGGWDRDPVLTDQDGSFELVDVEQGKHTLFATRRGGGEGTVEHVEVGATGVVIRIAPGASISGTVSLAEGGVPTQFKVSARDREQGSNREEEFYQTKGQWTLDDLPPGKYEVAVEAPEGRDTETITLADAEQKTGVALQLEPKVDVEGTLVDLETGEPVANMSVSISPRQGGGFMMFGGNQGAKENVSDAAGKFLVKAAPTGKVRIMMMPRTWGDDTYGWTMQGATIPGDVQRYTLPPLAVAKSRLKRGKQAGDLGFTTKETPPGADFEDTPIEVAFIRPGGPAAQSELAVGDEIVGVDGKEVTGDNAHRYRTLTRVPQGTRIALELQSGKTVEITAGKPP